MFLKPFQWNDCYHLLSYVSTVQEAFIVAFDCGEQEAFFDAWEELVPLAVRTHDAVGRDLELSLSVHFALYPLKYQVNTAYQSSKF